MSKIEVYNSIVTALEALTDIEHIALWNNQLENIDFEDAHNYPATFIEFRNILWDNNKLLAANKNTTPEQQGTSEIVIHCVFFQLEDETDSFVYVNSIIQKVYHALNRLSGSYFTPLLRSEEIQDINHDQLLDWQIVFTTSLYECGDDAGQTDATDSGTTTIGIEFTPTLDIDNIIIRTGDGD